MPKREPFDSVKERLIEKLASKATLAKEWKVRKLPNGNISLELTPGQARELAKQMKAVQELTYTLMMASGYELSKVLGFGPDNVPTYEQEESRYKDTIARLS